MHICFSEPSHQVTGHVLHAQLADVPSGHRQAGLRLEAISGHIHHMWLANRLWVVFDFLELLIKEVAVQLVQETACI